MLLSLRARDRSSKEDRDSRVLVAFLQALARTKLAGQPVFIALRRTTERAVFQAVRANAVHTEAVPLDAAGDPTLELHTEPTPFVACLAREVATRLASPGNGFH